MKQGVTKAWTKWRGIVSEQNESGQSVVAFCGERSLRAWHFYAWKKRLRDSEQGPMQFWMLLANSGEAIVIQLVK
jgi:hypothetical protein